MKRFTKLTIQIAVLSISMIMLSFITETDIWLEYFNSSCLEDRSFSCPKGLHYHWNYRGYVYMLTGLTYFILSIARIIISHNKDFFK